MTDCQFAMSINPSIAEHPDFAAWRPVVRPTSAYLHIPFCRHRCGYCNFSLVAGRDYLIERFLNAIEKEIGWLDQNYSLETLFLGGGTPSHLNPQQLQRLKRIVQSRFELAAGAEVTAECNPNDLTTEKVEALADFGVNRIILGAQSLNSRKLARLERDHRADEVANAIKLSRTFAKSVSIDLIFAAPDESLADWRRDLTEALSLGLDHLSTYELTYEKGTQFWNRRLDNTMAESAEDLRAEMYELAMDSATNAGLDQYEISSFARSEHACRHNEVYWLGKACFAFGPGASRYIDGCRQTNHPSTMTYLRRIDQGHLPVAIAERLSAEESARELLAVGLRRVQGVSEINFGTRTHYSVSQLLAERGPIWIAQGLLTKERGVWKLSRRGRMVYDGIAAGILSGR